MVRSRKEAETTFAGLEQSGPVFDRARRLAGALFGADASQAGIVLLEEQHDWRRHEYADLPATSPGARWVAEHDELLWVEDATRDPLLSDFTAALGPPFLRFYVAAPIRVEDAIPGVLAVGLLEPRVYDPALAARLQDLADFVADEWTRVKATKARDIAHGTLHAIIESASLSLALTDRELRIIYASPVWLAARGLKHDEAFGQTLAELFPGSFESWRDDLDRCLRGATREVDRAAMVRPDGSTCWLQGRVAPWRDGAGEVGGLILVAHDVTQMMEAMDQMTRAADRLELAVEIAKLYVWEIDFARGELTKIGAELDFFEQPQTFEGIITDRYATIDERDRPAVAAAWQAFTNEGEPYLAEYRMARSDDREQWVASTASLMIDASGKPLRLVGAIQDVTQRKKQERALIQAKEDAEAANRAKSTFLATISHEIRTPLNGLLGMAQAMAAGPLEPIQRDRLKIIQQSGEGLLSILNEVLDLSKIEAGKLTLEDSDFDAAELAQAACATFQAIAENKGLEFEVRILPAARGLYRGDPMRVRQILYNLVSNALKFTDRGAVRITVGRREGQLQIKVRDTGIGMTSEQQKNLFQAFEQAEASTTRRYGGTGLGLAICRQLSELMKGRISVKSAPGKGTSFLVSLPLAKLEPQAQPPVEPPAAAATGPDRPLRVLAAEDNSVNQLVLKTLLNQVGVDPVMVDDGRAAIEAWSREPWDLILMDVQMPLLDGPTATAEIRAREAIEGRPRTPIIALTANALDDQVSKYLAAGMDGFVAKPIAASRLFAALQAALEMGERGSEAAA